MSTPEPLDDLPEPEPAPSGPHSRLPFMSPELLAARMEAPDFAEVLGRARARVASEEYRPEKHHPWRPHVRGIRAVMPEEEERLREIIQRFSAKGAKWRPSVAPEREPAVESTRHLRAL